MTRRRGRARGGQRLLARIPHGHYQTSTLISGIRLEGPCAAWLFEGPVNGEMFLAWVTQGLAPALRPGEVVILDNLATHKIRGVREALEAAGAGLLYLPPYSRDFNPIEPMRSKTKQLLCAAKEAFQSISLTGCQGFLFWRSIRYIINGNALVSVLTEVDTLPAKKTGVHGPGARSEQRQGRPESRHQDVHPGCWLPKRRPRVRRWPPTLPR